MSISPLATVLSDRGRRRKSPRPTLLVIHQTGSDIAQRAHREGVPAEEMIASFYMSAPAYPNYLVSRDGSVYAYADEEERTAHAAWRPEELAMYERWDRDEATRRESRQFGWWWNRWYDRPRGFSSPLGLLRYFGGVTPNESGIGIELEAHRKPHTSATPEQLTSLARLCLDIGLRHAIPLGDGGHLPSPYLLGHSDVCPARRTARGQPWDPDAVLDWARLEGAIAVESDLTRWRMWV